MKKTTSDRGLSRVSGYRAAAKLTHRIINYSHRDQQDGLEDLGFPPPRGTRAVRLCALTGKLATDACDRVSLEYLRVGEEPVAPCDAHLRMAVDTRDGRVASSRTPPQFREVRTFVQLPPLYAAWSARAGLPRPPMQVSMSLAEAPRGAGRLIYGQPVSIRIASPQDGLRLLRDPETPAGMSTLALRAVVDPPSEQLLWYVDGVPFELTDYPYTVRWPLEPGEHTIQARLPHTDAVSSVVGVMVE